MPVLFVNTLPTPIKYFFTVVFLAFIVVFIQLFYRVNPTKLPSPSNINLLIDNFEENVQIPDSIGSPLSLISTRPSNSNLNPISSEALNFETLSKENLIESRPNDLSTNSELSFELIYQELHSKHPQFQIDKLTLQWAYHLIQKLRCIQHGVGGLYHYHTRKAAGTTLRKILETASDYYHVKYYETEGISMDRRFLSLPNPSHPHLYSHFPLQSSSSSSLSSSFLYSSLPSSTSSSSSSTSTVPSLLTLTSLRDPIKRILSLYWYEHVGWFDGVQKNTNKCLPLKQWVEGWKDSSEWKRQYQLANPSSVYVEIENYYVKMLTGWIGPGEIGEKESQQARRVIKGDVIERRSSKSGLEKGKEEEEEKGGGGGGGKEVEGGTFALGFDVIFLTEWMDDETQLRAMQSLFPGTAKSIHQENNNNPRPSSSSSPSSSSTRLSLNHLKEVEGDKSARERLKQRLAPDEVDIVSRLREMNKWDLLLWEEVKNIQYTRLSLIPTIVSSFVTGDSSTSSSSSSLSSSSSSSLSSFHSSSSTTTSSSALSSSSSSFLLPSPPFLPTDQHQEQQQQSSISISILPAETSIESTVERRKEVEEKDFNLQNFRHRQLFSSPPSDSFSSSSCPPPSPSSSSSSSSSITSFPPPPPPHPPHPLSTRSLTSFLTSDFKDSSLSSFRASTASSSSSSLFRDRRVPHQHHHPPHSNLRSHISSSSHSPPYHQRPNNNQNHYHHPPPHHQHSSSEIEINLIHPSSSSSSSLSSSSHLMMCYSPDSILESNPSLSKQLGIFQGKGHKGPFQNFQF